MFDYTNRVKKIINEYAPKEAKRLGHDHLGPEHILLGLMKAQDSVAMKIIMSLNIDIADLRKEIERRCEQDGMTLLVDPASKDKVAKILEYSREEAKKLRHSYIGSEHILLAILRDTSSIASASLGAFSVTYQVIRNELNQTLGLPQNGPINFKTGGPGKKEQTKTPMLDEFARNLTRMAQDKLIDPIIGRDKEIDRVIQILSRKTKNNPILIGEAGVGKTAIVEGLAQRILQKKVPENLFQRRVYSLDVAALIAGTKYRGEFEDRIKKIMKEIRSSSDVVLFIDEVHTIIGAGAAEGAVDAANILKPALARGEIQCIGATTLKEYKKYIERDSALERRFQTVMVDEPSIQDAIRILAGLRKSYEKHHGVTYSRESIQASVRLSDRYLTERYLPDKAIDVIDEAGAQARLKLSTVPESIKGMEKSISKLIKEKNEMVRLQEYEKAAKLRDSIVANEREMAESMENWRREQKEKKIFITESDVVGIIADWTGIPMNQLSETESKKLLEMENELGERVIGQKTAIRQISKAIRRSRTGLKSPRRPIGSFIFLGPTGVGKTELAKALAEFMFGDEESLIRFDMSEYMEPHSVSKFIGSPPGYVGYEDGGQLTEAVRRKPHSIILFDEIEKAHNDMQNILLQILDEGELTDTMGHRVDFKETIIIMTSNLGARHLMKGGKLGFESEAGKAESKKDQVMDELRKFFSPEFINRIDDVIVFDMLKPEEIREIVELMVDEINMNILHKNLYIVPDKEALDYLGEKGFDEKYGARPLRRLVQKEIEDELA
ncbi:MAG: ATP-dependent Clp protease ATP-binding subunit, partial [Leptospiraceae bacterium]|nr:ATP-dependent Clp protease ATP-binding subunit [Leptospiraceae bacterium]